MEHRLYSLSGPRSVGRLAGPRAGQGMDVGTHKGQWAEDGTSHNVSLEEKKVSGQQRPLLSAGIYWVSGGNDVTLVSLSDLEMVVIVRLVCVFKKCFGR